MKLYIIGFLSLILCSCTTSDSSDPSVSLKVDKDLHKGYNINISTTDFDLYDFESDGKSEKGGYAKLTVDGIEYRVYGEYFYLGALEEGDREIKVTLYNADHTVIEVDGEPVSFETTIAAIDESGEMSHHDDDADDMDHDTENMDHEHDTEDMEHEHSHDGESSAGTSIHLHVFKDSNEGFNINLDLEHFSLTPENVNTANKANEGHAHLFIDDVKITRIYSAWHHISSLSEGDHVIRVELSNNDHSGVFVSDEMIYDEVELNSDDLMAGHDH